MMTYEHSQIVSAAAFGAILELVVIPFSLISLGQWLDRTLSIDTLFSNGTNIFLAVLCFILGVPLLVWTIVLQHTRGHGTPLPLVPTKRLLTDGPYRYTRNPMTCGAIMWLSGWALMANSPTALLVGVTLFATIALAYIKSVEEREMSRRFGQAYKEYKDKTAFLLPFIKVRYGGRS